MAAPHRIEPAELLEQHLQAASPDLRQMIASDDCLACAAAHPGQGRHLGVQTHASQQPEAPVRPEFPRPHPGCSVRASLPRSSRRAPVDIRYCFSQIM